MKSSAIALSVALLSGAAHATVIAPTDHYSPFTTSEGANSLTESAGFYAGDTGPSTSETARIYSKFSLPSFAPSQVVAAAAYSIRYANPYEDPTGALGLFRVASDAWTEADGWSSMAALGSLITTFTPTTFNTTLTFDVTSYVNSEFGGDGFASFALASMTEFDPTIKSWYYFEAESAQLDVTLRDNGNNVPEPATVGLIALGLLGLGISRRRLNK